MNKRKKCILNYVLMFFFIFLAFFPWTKKVIWKIERVRDIERWKSFIYFFLWFFMLFFVCCLKRKIKKKAIIFKKINFMQALLQHVFQKYCYMMVFNHFYCFLSFHIMCVCVCVWNNRNIWQSFDGFLFQLWLSKDTTHIFGS